MPTRSTVLHEHEHQQDKNETDWLKQLSIDYLIEELTRALLQITGWWSRTEDRREQRIIRWRANPFFITVTDYRLMITYRREQGIIRLHKETLMYAFNCNGGIKQQSDMSRKLDRLLAQEQYNQRISREYDHATTLSIQYTEKKVCLVRASFFVYWKSSKIQVGKFPKIKETMYR